MCPVGGIRRARRRFRLGARVPARVDRMTMLPRDPPAAEHVTARPYRVGVLGLGRAAGQDWL